MHDCQCGKTLVQARNRHAWMMCCYNRLCTQDLAIMPICTVCQALVAAFVSGAAHAAGLAPTSLESGVHQQVICPSRTRCAKEHSCASCTRSFWHHCGWSSCQIICAPSQYRHGTVYEECARVLQRRAPLPRTRHHQLCPPKILANSQRDWRIVYRSLPPHDQPCARERSAIRT